MLGRLGADLVGMSTALEAIAARQLGAEVLGISLVTNLAAGLGGQSLSHAEVVEAGRASAIRMGTLLAAVLPSALSERADGLRIQGPFRVTGIRTKRTSFARALVVVVDDVL
jgi:hypothetical protein